MDDDQVTEVDLDTTTRKALEHIRELWAETLPLLAVVESLLGIPEGEQYVGREWLPAPDNSNGE